MDDNENHLKRARFSPGRIALLSFVYVSSIFLWGLVFPFVIGWGIWMFFTLPFFFCWVVVFYAMMICLCFGLSVSVRTNMVPPAIIGLCLAIPAMYVGYRLTVHFWQFPNFLDILRDCLQP
jgi:hypothetical protein